jgi:hypothetical protein
MLRHDALYLAHITCLSVSRGCIPCARYRLRHSTGCRLLMVMSAIVHEVHRCSGASNPPWRIVNSTC